jgi:hypothetical protein
MSQIQQQIRTPFCLDSCINNRNNSKPGKNKDSIIENVRLVVTSETVYEDEALGMSKNIITQEEFASMDKLVLEKMMLGIDLDE